MSANPVLWNLDERGVATVTLNRPEVNNAYDAGLIGGVLQAMDGLGNKPNLRVVVLKGNGKHFQAGADLKWINGVRPKSPEENEAVSRATFEAVQRLNTLPIPTVALVQGGCFGGGTGVISACDVVIAADNALFSITEVRWGLTAAIIIPQLCDAIGVRQVRRYALTGERFGAEDARRIGLVHDQAAGDGKLVRRNERGRRHLCAPGPDACRQAPDTGSVGRPGLVRRKTCGELGSGQDMTLFSRPRSATPADAAQAFVNRVVFLPHLLQRFHRRVAAGLGLALGGQRSFLARVTGFPLGLGLDEPALLHLRRSGGGADQEAKQNG
jgi:methylglutaconyl-CoA hydratase